MEIHGGTGATEQAVSTPGMDIWVYSQPYESAKHGGDVYYVSLCGGGKITRFIVADVSGHGASVADLALSLRSLMRKNINRKDQSRLVQALNREFGELAKLSRFATAVVATYLTTGDRLSVSNAGHPRPLFRSAVNGEWSYLTHRDSQPGVLADLPLGILKETGYSQVELLLKPDDLILFYTDAMTEARNAAGQQLGETGLIKIMRELDAADPGDIPRMLVSAINEFTGGADAEDDMTFLLLRHNAGPTRKPGLLETMSVYAKVLGLRSV
jgi:serine phosphatase RsbU (regulator of sigma subunit)